MPKKKLEKHKYTVLPIVRQDGLALKNASEQLKADREIVLAAVTNAPQALEYASEALKSDRSLVLRALKQDGMALKHAAGRLKADKRIILAAIAQNPEALQFASKALKKDKDIITALPKSSKKTPKPPSLGLFKLHHDEERIAKALQSHARLYENSPPELKTAEDILLTKQKQHVHEYLDKHGLYHLSYKDRLKKLNQIVEHVKSALQDKTSRDDKLFGSLKGKISNIEKPKI
ncbi:MAG: DUF4116 domain-containing protein [Gammaproteobacteria bacterium]|nr:DUF4116 domain-containing protein [Gammaproteobacteria bacterium]